PTSIPGAAPAAGTHSAATAARAAAVPPSLLNTGRRASPALDPAAQALFEVDLGLPAEQLPRPRDVGAAHLRIVLRQRLEDDLARGAGDADAGLGELEHRQLVDGVADIDRQMLARLGEQDEPADRVLDVTERP